MSNLGIAQSAITERSGSSGGGSGTPGGSNGDIQYNNSGSFGGSAATITAAGSENLPLGQSYEIDALNALTFPNSDITSVAIGPSALLSQNATGSHNIAIGQYAGTALTSGVNNVAVGYSALATCSSGGSNVAIGLQALNLSTSNGNVGIGQGTLSALGTGGNNVGIGSSAGNSLTGGASNIFIGAGSQPLAATDSNEIVIGVDTTGNGSNTVTIGTSVTTSSLFYGTLLINGTDTGLSRISAGVIGVGNGTAGSTAGTLQASTVTAATVVATTVYYANTTPGVTQTAEAVGTLACIGGIVTTFTGVSDERLKIFRPYSGGLHEILGITPIRYRWNEKGQELSGQRGDRDYIGFSANNVQTVIPEAIQSKKGPEEYLSFDDRPVIAALVNAVKELSARVQELENRQ